jgi:hypothetical protein
MVMETDFTPLLNSDLARDVRAELVEHFTSGASVPDSTLHVLTRFHDVLNDPNDGPVVILAVAAFQLDHSQLQPLIRDAAIDLIESGEAQTAWKSADADLRVQRRDLLQQLLTSLKDAAVIEA